MKPKIGFLGDVFSVYDKTGIYQYARGMLRGLVERRANIVMFLSSAEVSREFEIANTLIADYCGVGKITNSAFLPNLLFFIRNVKLTRDLNKLVDVLYSPQCRITDLSYLLNLKIPTLTTLHDVHAFMAKTPLSYKIRFALRYMVPKMFAKKENAFLAVPTSFTRDRIIEYLRIPWEKMRIIPAPVEAPIWALRMSKKRAKSMIEEATSIRDYILFLGRQEQIKTVLTVIKSLNENFPIHVQTAIAGMGVNSLITRRLIHALGLEEKVIVLGAVSESFKWILLRGATLFLFPDYPIGGFGIPPVEAMSVGTPVVASKTGPLPEVVGEGGLLARNNKEIAESIYQCYTDQEMRKKVVEKGFEQAKLFSPKNVASRLLKYLGEIILESS